MSQWASQRLLARAILALTLAGLVACRPDPAPPSSSPVHGAVDPPAKVKIFMMETGNPSVKWIRVNEVGVGICKHGERCATSFSFELQTPHIKDTDEIRITTVGGDPTCLSPKPDYTLTKARPDLTISFDQTCGDGTKAFWTYMIECAGPPSGNCGGARPADPGVIIEGGPPGA